jgi:hypothetical protein
MFPAIFNSIIFDENMDLSACINNEFISAALTAQELTVIVPLIKSLVSCDSVDEILIIAGYTASTLMSDLKISLKTIEEWERRGFSEYEKYSLIFMITANELFHLRYKTCQIDGRDYFSSDPNSDVCPQCASEMYKYFFPF